MSTATVAQLVGACAGAMSLAGIVGGVAIAQRDRRLLVGALGAMIATGVLWAALSPVAPRFGLTLGNAVLAWSLGWAVRRYRARRPEEARWRAGVMAVAQSIGILVVGFLVIGTLAVIAER